MINRTSKFDNPTSEKVLAAADVERRYTAHLQQRRLILTLAGTLIALFSVALFLGKEAQAQVTQVVNDQTAPALEDAATAQQEPAPVQTAPIQDQAVQPVADSTATVQEQAAPVEEQVTPIRQTTDPVRETVEPVQQSVEPATDPVQ